tara:strand:+ start:3082 stop:4635 length:1554 start_codon:yes stop_codon:yes gene_type:complete
MYTNQNDPLSQQLDSMNETFQKNPAMAQKYASIPQKTMETLTAQRVVNEFAKQNRKLQEEAFVGRTGNPNSTVDDDLKSKGVMLSKDLTSLKAQAVGDAARGQQMDQQNALNKLVSANKRSPVGGIGRLLNNPNAAPASTRGGGVPALGANNMRGMPPGGITPPAAPMRAAQGGLVSFNGEEGSFVGGEEEGEETTTMPSSGASNRTYNLFKELREEEKREAKEEAARIIESFEKEERGGIFSDDAVQRMIDFGGARTLSEGFRQSSSAANQREAAERKELNDALAGIRKDGSALTAASLQAAIAAGQLDLKEQQVDNQADQFLLTLDNEKFQFTAKEKQFVLGLEAKADEFDRLLMFKVDDANTQLDIKRTAARADAIYKDSMVRLAEIGEVNKATSSAIQLATLRQNFIDSSTALLQNSGIDGDDLMTRIDGLVDTFESSTAGIFKQAVGTSSAGARDAVSELVKKGESVSEAIKRPAGEETPSVRMPPRSKTVQEMTDDVVNSKKRGGIISLMG